MKYVNALKILTVYSKQNTDNSIHNSGGISKTMQTSHSSGKFYAIPQKVSHRETLGASFIDHSKPYSQ